MYVGNCSVFWPDVGSAATGGSSSFARKRVGAVISTSRSFGVGNNTSNVSSRASQPNALNCASSHSALSLPYGEPRWCGRALNRRAVSLITAGSGSARNLASQPSDEGGAWAVVTGAETMRATRTVTTRRIDDPPGVHTVLGSAARMACCVRSSACARRTCGLLTTSIRGFRLACNRVIPWLPASAGRDTADPSTEGGSHRRTATGRDCDGARRAGLGCTPTR